MGVSKKVLGTPGQSREKNGTNGNQTYAVFTAIYQYTRRKIAEDLNLASTKVLMYNRLFNEAVDITMSRKRAVRTLHVE